MTTTAVSTTKTITVAGIGPVELTVEEQGEGRSFLVLHGGAGPQSVAAFAQLLAEKGHSRVLTSIHPGFGGTPRPEALNSVAKLATLYSDLLDDLGLEDVTVIGNSVGGWIAAEMALLDSPLISGIVLIDAVGIEVEGHPVADVSGLSVPEIQALSFHDPTPLRVDPDHHPGRPESNHGGQRRCLGRLCRFSRDGRPYAARPAERDCCPDPGSVGRERSDCRAPLRAGVCRCHPRGALRGASGHWTHAPDGDARSSSRCNSPRVARCSGQGSWMPPPAIPLAGSEPRSP